MDNKKEKSKIELIEEADMAPEIDDGIKKLLCACFPTDVETFSRSRHWHGSAPAYSLIYRENEKVMGQVGIVLRTVSVGGKPTSIAGIQSMATSPDSRGSMLAWALMRRSMAEAKRRGVPFGLLFCVPDLERLYTALKWVLIDVAVTMTYEEENKVPIPGKNITMFLKLGDDPFPEGDIYLEGADW